MYLVEAVLLLGSPQPFTDDAVTDLIERLVDELDGLPVEPSVGTTRLPDGQLQMIVGVVIDQESQLAAAAEGTAIITAGLKKVGIGDPKGLVPVKGAPMTSSVSELQPV